MCVILVNGIWSFYAGDNKVGGVIGGVFGGLAVVLLAVVTVVIVVFILKLKRRYSKMIINYY